MRRFTLGDYPTRASATPAKPRGVMTRRKYGTAPTRWQKGGASVQWTAAREGIGTLSALLDLYGRQKRGHSRGGRECRATGSTCVFKPLLAKPVATLKAGDFQLHCGRMPRKRRQLRRPQHLRPALKWAAHRGYCAADLAQHRAASPGGAPQAHPDPRRTRRTCSQCCGRPAAPTPPRCGLCC